MSLPPFQKLAARRERMHVLYRSHYAYLVRLANLLVSDESEAEDIVQEAFAKTWVAAGSIHSDRSELAYLRSTVVNVSRSHLRRRRLAQRFLPKLWSPRQERSNIEAQMDLLQALAKLPPRRRECLVLRYFADLSERETASLLGIAPGTVKSQTFKGLQTLRRLLGDVEPQPFPDGDNELEAYQ